MRTTEQRQTTEAPDRPGAATGLGRPAGDHPLERALAPSVPPGTGLEREERDARRGLRRQITRLELRLAEQVSRDLRAGARGRLDIALDERLPAGPRLLSLGELEQRRDQLVARLAAVDADRAREQANRELLAAMYRDPAAHRYARLRSADLAERGCRVYEVRPRLGVLGLLGGWWRVKVASGCPLPAAAAGTRAAPRARPVTAPAGDRSRPLTAPAR